MSLLTRVAVTVRRPTPKVPAEYDSYGNRILVNPTPTHVLNDCVYEPRASLGNENVDARDQVMSGMTLYCDDPDADLRSEDEVFLDGVWWQVNGQVGRWKMGSAVDHCAVVLTRTTG